MNADGHLCDASSSAWPLALSRLRHDVYHHPGYVAQDADRIGGQPVCFVYERSGHVLALPLLLRPINGSGRVDATSPYGYPGPVSDTQDERFWESAARALVRALAERGVVSCFVRLHPLLGERHDALARHGLVQLHGETVSIDLRLPAEEAWRQVRNNHRRHINAARRAGRTTTVDDWRHLDAFVAMYRATMSRRGAAAEYFFDDVYFTGLRKALDDELHLAVVLDGETPIGGGLFFEHDGIVQYHLGGTDAEHLAEHPSKLIIDDVRQWAALRGNRTLHLGAGLGGQPGPLFHFKAGFSDERHPFHTWRVIVDPAEYARLARGRPDAGGYFPVYRAPATSSGS